MSEALTIRIKVHRAIYWNLHWSQESEAFHVKQEADQTSDTLSLKAFEVQFQDHVSDRFSKC